MVIDNSVGLGFLTGYEPKVRKWEQLTVNAVKLSFESHPRLLVMLIRKDSPN